MPDYAALKKKVDELAARKWDDAGIDARVKKMFSEGIQRKDLDPKTLLENKQEILDRVQLRAEEYNYYFKNCSQGTAMALLEEFGLGTTKNIEALEFYPGIGGTGEVCGGITGGLVALGLFFNRDKRIEPEQIGKGMKLAQKFIAFFEDEVGDIHCADIIETVVIGKKLNPGESDAAMASFAGEKGFEKCGLPPGMGARLCAEFIIDYLNKA